MTLAIRMRAVIARVWLLAAISASVASPVASPVASAADPVTTMPWREAVISVTHPDVTARFFKEIGGYEELGRGRLSASAIAAWGLDASASGGEDGKASGGFVRKAIRTNAAVS